MIKISDRVNLLDDGSVTHPNLRMKSMLNAMTASLFQELGPGDGDPFAVVANILCEVMEVPKVKVVTAKSLDEVTS